MYEIKTLFAFIFQLAQDASGHIDPFSFVMLELAILVVIAMIGRWMASRLGQPAVLGELGFGMIVANIAYWLHIPFFMLIMHMGDAGEVITQAFQQNISLGQVADSLVREGRINPVIKDLLTGPDATRLIILGISIWIFSNFGVLLLMFMVGLGTSVSEMKSVGGRASLVAIVGVICSFITGYIGGYLALPDENQGVYLFIGAILCATSVGISARVFQSLHNEQSREARIVFGASVVDDVASIIILAVVIGIITTGRIDILSVGKILILACLFLGGLMLYGERLVGRIVSRLESLERANAKLIIPLILLFAFSWFANLIQLATITGAFGAGLVIGDQFFGNSGNTIEELIGPLESVFAPIFFVLMGMQVNLSTLSEPSVLSAAIVITLAAVLGKLATGLIVGKDTNRLTIGMGMVPRGEEALLFASIGLTMGVITGGLFSAVVIMVMLTAFLAPLGLKWSIVSKGK